MIPTVQQRVVLAKTPSGVPVPDDFRVETASVPAPGDGQVLMRTIYLSLDPYLRSAIAGRHMGHPPTRPGELLPGRAIAEVVTAGPGLEPGTLVLAETGWQQYATANARVATRITDRESPLSTHLGVLGMPGLTGWVGVTDLLRPTAGDTVVVSAPVGAVGSTAGQIARIAGCRVVGISSSPEKCRIAVDEFGFDACVNYKDPEWRQHLEAACPDGVAGYFDNTGGDILEAVLGRLIPYGRVALCGLIDQYNTGVPYKLSVASIIGKRAEMRGLVVYDHAHEQEAYARRAAAWLGAGRLRYREDRAEGIESAPAAFCRLMSGQNIGKSLVVVGEEPH